MTALHPELGPVVRELELDAASGGWDQPARLFALVRTDELLDREPGLADMLADSGSLTPIEQEELPADLLEEILPQIGWPDEVAGAAAVVEATQPDGSEVRIVAAVDRNGGTWCALRMRAHDEDASVLVGADLVPTLVELLRATFEGE